MIYFLDKGRFFHRYIEIGNNEGEDMHTVQRIVVTVVIILFYMTSVSFAEDIFVELTLNSWDCSQELAKQSKIIIIASLLRAINFATWRLSVKFSLKPNQAILCSC